MRNNEVRRWYVARLRPGAGRSDLKDDRFTKVERELIDAGFDCYMPVEVFDAVHRRKKKLIRKKRQLVPGYVFVADIENFWALSQCKTIAGVIGVAGQPLALRNGEIEAIRMAETAIFEALAIERHKAAEKARKVSGRSLRKHYPKGARARVNNGFLKGREGTVQEATGRKTLRIILEDLQNLGMIEIDIDEIDLVA